jgi:hypothetical protein
MRVTQTPLVIALAALNMLPAATATAGIGCEFYRACCNQLVELYREQGVPGFDIRNFIAACDLADVMEQMGPIGEDACFESWKAISQESYRHFLEGRLGAYPESCMEAPLEDRDDPMLELEPEDLFPPEEEEGTLGR